jgi:mannose-6-phosphate isomerase-like protein (cupin superfamily)
MHSFHLWYPLLLLILAPAAAMAQAPGEAAPAAASKPEPRLLSLDAGGQDYLRLIAPPESVTMRAGVVTLAPGKSVGKHSTKENEEIVVVLEGEGTMTFAGGVTLSLKAGTAAYGPPQTEHDVTNSGKGTLKYIFIVARAQ